MGQEDSKTEACYLGGSEAPQRPGRRALVGAEHQGKSYCNILHSEGEWGKAGFPGNYVFGAKITRELGTALLSSHSEMLLEPVVILASVG